MHKLWGAVLVTVLSAPFCLGQGSDQIDLKKLSLEELMEIDVTSVSRRAGSLDRTAAAVTILTAEDLRRAGVSNIPEALRLVPGVQVARVSAGSWAISMRGFNSATANKVLVLVDGRPVYSPLFSGTFWETVDLVIDDVARIEVVRGPGATLFGANAVNGVINIISKSAHETKGNVAILYGGGADDLAASALRMGGTLGTDSSYRGYGKYFYRDETKLSNGEDARDSARIGRMGFRIDASEPTGDWTFLGDVYGGLEGVREREDAKIFGGNILARWRRDLANGSEIQVQTYFERNYRRVPLQSDFNQRSFEIDMQYQFARGNHHVVWGAGYRWNADRTHFTPLLVFDPAERSYPVWSGFMQDELSLLDDRIRLVLGSKVEHNVFVGFEFQPSVRANIALKPAETIWAAVSRAVRTPTRFDSDLRFGSPESFVINGNPDFESEKLTSYELGYRAHPYPQLTLDVATYYNVYDKIRTIELSPQPSNLVLMLMNNGNARTYGGEAVATYDAAEWLRFSTAYSYFHKNMTLEPGTVDVLAGAFEGNDPAHQFFVRGSANLTRGFELDSTLRFVDHLPSPPVPRYTELDVRVGWTRGSTEFSISGRNLLHGQHAEFGQPGPFLPEVQRNIFARVTVKF